MICRQKKKSVILRISSYKGFVLISYVHWMPKEWVRWSKRNNPKLRRAPQGPNGCFAITKRGNLINLRIGLVYWHYTLDCEKKIRLTRKKKKQPKALRGSAGSQWAAQVYKRAAWPRRQVRSEPAAMTVTQVHDSQRFHWFPPFFCVLKIMFPLFSKLKQKKIKSQVIRMSRK